MTGQTLAHYRILEKLGEGGMGVVYKAEDTRLRRTVALKLLRDSAQADEDLRARFIREAQAAAVLEHPNICQVYELNSHDGHLFLAMAFADGFPLSRLRGPARPSLFHTLRIVIQIAEGLQHAHNKGIVHRDIKTENIILSPNGVPRITDFGLALVRDRSRLTRPGTIMGTVTHMSPEQALAQPTDRRSDIWSLAVVLYDLAEGRLPFSAPNPQSTLALVTAGPLPPLTSVPEPHRKELNRILVKALAKKPPERYQYIDDFIVDLRAILAKLPHEAYQPSNPAPNPDAPTLTDPALLPQPKPLPLLLAPAVILLLLAVYLLFFRH